ncbi:hypothetical protein Gasu2_03610 [Galdieria sulphuraria]|uniref:Uncharacterized protein n=1 Tax=Galdieria sulphuraria TaxID=130081 RepID=M2Y057_GALSU|nr:uncharacterized protein Gasu_32830 [Galdieria sulphuraria]EME29273.1 hypothetical protein Gasu_32830 [Galdieria sulphuraria]GJD05916.1 hypothetical protein Gasu2_03610 [Galdieria sulphuraria]|eukprot:XP_005705793.1 hypothetical protein Gasu_32830 [Galdieria sulphuraria]
MGSSSFVSVHLIKTSNQRPINRHRFYSLPPTTKTFNCNVKRTLSIRCCSSGDTSQSTTTDSQSTTSGRDAQASKKLYRVIDYPIHTEAYLGSEHIRESLWKYTYERTQREEEADRNLEQLAEQFNSLKKQVEDALREQGVDPKEAFQEADAIFTPAEEMTKDPIEASIERGCPPDDIDLGDYPYIDVPDIPENLELENLGWVGLKELGASPLPEMIEDIQARRSGVVGDTRSRVDETSSLEEEGENGEDTDFASTSLVPDFAQENKVYVKEGLGWRIGYEPFSIGEQCATVGSKDYLITMNREEFFHFRRLLMSLDHKLTDMTYHSSESSEAFSNSHYVLDEHEKLKSTNGMEDTHFVEPYPIMDLESDVLRIQAFGRPSWFSLRIFLKRKRPVECSWDAEATQGLLKAVHEVDHVASLF